MYNALFEWVLREVEEIQPEENEQNKELIYIEDLIKMTRVLTTKKPEIITHKSIGNVYVCLGKAGKKSYGLRHIIYKRAIENRTDDEISAILSLICSAVHDGNPEPSYNDSIMVTKNGVSAIITKLVSENGKTGILTGYDLTENEKEATDAIQTVIAQYNSAPEYSEFRNQVVAVASNI